MRGHFKRLMFFPNNFYFFDDTDLLPIIDVGMASLFLYTQVNPSAPYKRQARPDVEVLHNGV